MGMLFNCIKRGDAGYLQWMMRRVGVEQSLVLVEPSKNPNKPPKWRCNLLRYALMTAMSTGSRVERVVALLMSIVEMAERGEKVGGVGDKFWSRPVRQLLRNVVQICLAARGTVSMRMIHDAILSLHRTPAAVKDKAWQAASFINRLIDEAETKKGERGAREQSDYELAARYICTEFAGMPPDTQGSVLATYSVLADVLLRGDMADLFDSDTNFVPEITFLGGVICLNLPLKTYGQAALYVQAAFTYLWQLAVERRDVSGGNVRPVAWYCDEAHEVISPHTGNFLANGARSSLAACVLITQNISICTRH